MNTSKIVKELMALRGRTYESLSVKLGFANPSGVSNKVLRAKSMRVDSLVQIADAMDCEVVVRSKLADKREWTITLEDEPKERE